MRTKPEDKVECSDDMTLRDFLLVIDVVTPPNGAQLVDLPDGRWLICCLLDKEPTIPITIQWGPSQ